MKIGSTLLLLSAATALAACQAPSPTAGPSTWAGPTLLGDVRPASPRGEQGGGVGVYRGAVTVGDGANGAHLIFLNFDGAMLRAPKFQDDSANNESWIAGGNVTFPAFDATPYAPAFTRDAAITAITNLVKGFYAPFNVEVVTTRPASPKQYTMCMVGGTPQLLGQPQGVAGVAPLDCGNQNEPDVVYAFAEDLDPNNTGSASASMKAIAVTAAQETAHAFGLGHTTDQTDLMYPQLLPSQKAFSGASKVQQDGSGKCGDGVTQDSAGMLKSVLGPSTGMTSPSGPTPTVTFLAPTKGQTVPLDFTILVSASEAGGTITKVEVTSGSQSLLSATKPPYKTSVTAPQAGTYDLTATAYDAAGNSQSATITFTAAQGAPPQVLGCLTKDECDPGMTCQSGKCVADSAMTPTPGACTTPCPSGFACQPDGSCAPAGSSTAPKAGETGAACTLASDCHSGICGTFNGAQLCTAVCDPSAAATCPSSMSCQAAGSGVHVCAPNAATGGRGCSAAPSHGPHGPEARDATPLGVVALLLVGLALPRRRWRS
jgi:hypothetical protein